jgi:hypothetical protein
MTLRVAHRPLGGEREACVGEDDLVIGVAQSPSSLHAYIDAGGIKGYVRAAADHEL